MATTRLSRRGQITIPKDVRDRLGLRPGDEIELLSDETGVRLRKRSIGRSVEKWIGYLNALDGQDPDDLVSELRGR